MDITPQLEQGLMATGWGSWDNTDAVAEVNAWGPGEWGGWDTDNGQEMPWDTNTECMPVDNDQECSSPLPIWSDSVPTWGHNLTSHHSRPREGTWLHSNQQHYIQQLQKNRKGDRSRGEVRGEREEALEEEGNSGNDEQNGIGEDGEDPPEEGNTLVEGE
ncbi:hypothetical protein F5J12DRAFT_787325 [Pisolithus orientalis]|uniref:uncharacterized protein n=1 Tax=Pisolithus orientalis TaxID=936130 RepID=UPI002225201F|nr:uncharacterized protein F5J12DRAFT_787325 [Pisolithus orientalis]KAI5985823.1 hypothetical protein F5J12DRAFT_787325 [Pisolithus orientalis]